jgi:predicted transcriptional regulator YdeE
MASFFSMLSFSEQDNNGGIPMLWKKWRQKVNNLISEKKDKMVMSSFEEFLVYILANIYVGSVSQ